MLKTLCKQYYILYKSQCLDPKIPIRQDNKTRLTKLYMTVLINIFFAFAMSAHLHNMIKIARK